MMMIRCRTPSNICWYDRHKCVHVLVCVIQGVSFTSYLYRVRSYFMCSPSNLLSSSESFESRARSAFRHDFWDTLYVPRTDHLCKFQENVFTIGVHEAETLMSSFSVGVQQQQLLADTLLDE